MHALFTVLQTKTGWYLITGPPKDECVVQSGLFLLNVRLRHFDQTCSSSRNDFPRFFTLFPISLSRSLEHGLICDHVS